MVPAGFLSLVSTTWTASGAVGVQRMSEATSEHAGAGVVYGPSVAVTVGDNKPDWAIVPVTKSMSCTRYV